MARAFIASVPLALVLVAALVVPVARTPGTFGFHDWPTAKPERVAHDPLPASPAPVAVVPAQPVKRQRARGEKNAAPRDLVAVRPNAVTPAPPAPATGTTPAQQPATGPGQGSSGPGATVSNPGDEPAQAPAPPLPEPQTPAADAPAAPVQVAEDVLAPVLREVPLPPPPEPAPALAPALAPDATDDPEGSHGWDHRHGRGHRSHDECGGATQECSTEGS